MVTDPLKELENLIELGIDRVLTSGQKDKAIEGLKLLKELKKMVKNRIKIMPGSGVNKSNIKKFKSFDEIKFGEVKRPTAQVKITNDITLGFISLNNSEKLNKSS